MINKKSLWFLTLFSLILVLSVYYITMPSDFLLKKEEKTNKTSSTKNDAVLSIEEPELIVTLKVNSEIEREKEIQELRTELTKEESTSEEKNEAYERIKYISNLSAQEQSIEKMIKKEYEIDSFVKISNNEIKVVAVKADHNKELANNIMKTIQSEFENRMSIIIQFE